MSKKLIVFYLLLPLFAFSQQPVSTKATFIGNNPTEEFFSSKCLPLDSAITTALYYDIYNWLGSCYKYAGSEKLGIDCSGFIKKLYKDIYCMDLMGGSADIFKGMHPIEKNDLQEGDLVFFKINKGKISHVGIYLRNHKFAHAAVKGGVIISDLNESYYKKYFFKGGRFMPNRCDT